MKKKLLYNLLGTLFDKGLVLFISFFLTSFITVDAFGKWALFLQLIIISNSLTFGPLYNIFSRSFSSEGKHKVQIYHFKELFFLMLLASVISFFYFKSFKISLSFFLTLVVFGIYNYLVVYFRFSNNEGKYIKVSFVRFLLFTVLVSIGLKLDVDYFTTIIFSFLFSNLVVILPFINTISFFKSKFLTKKEFFTLMVYGLFSSLLSGIDKIFIGTIGDDSLLGVYSYVIALATASNLFVEVFKKSVVPSMFKDYNDNSKLSDNVIKLRIRILVGLFFIQMITPFLLFYILLQLDLANKNFYNVDSFYLILLMQSFAFSIFSWYHFINPFFIHLKKSNIMSYSMVFGVIIYVVLFLLTKTNNVFQLSLYKSILLLFPTLITGWYSYKIFNKKQIK